MVELTFFLQKDAALLAKVGSKKYEKYLNEMDTLPGLTREQVWLCMTNFERFEFLLLHCVFSRSNTFSLPVIV